MSRRRHHHHKPPSPNRCHHAVQEEPMMIHSHRDDDDDRRRRRTRPVAHLQPNVIARLMGMDDGAIVAGAAVQFQGQPRRTNKRGLQQLPYYHSYDDDAESGSRICLHRMMLVPRSRSSSSRLRRRRHPQEEDLLQKMARYGFGLGLGHSKVTQLPLIKNKKQNGSVVQGEGDPSSEHDHEHAAAAAEPAAMPDESGVVVVTAPSHYHHPAAAAAAAAAAEPAAEAQELPSHGHTPIVLLKPATTCSESETAGGVAIGGGQKTSVLFGLPKLHRDAGMSALLQEVKNRVQRELTLTAATATGCGEPIKTPASAWAIPPLQQATKEDPGNKRRLLRRSESFRAFRRDRKRNASPEAHILRNQTVASPKKADDEESVADPSLSVLRPGVGGVPDGRSFRSECLTTKHRDDDATASSPRLLFRSFSAPESGFAFSLGRLFSFMKQEDSEPAAAEVRMTSKNVVSAGFSSFIRGTVSSLRRHGFSSRRNLMMFRRKAMSRSNKTASVGAGEIHPAKMDTPICSATTPPHETFNLFKVAQANLSELPPSPVSPLEVAAGHSSRHFFTKLHFTLSPELSPKCLSELEAPATASESTASYRTGITAVEAAWSRDKAYITELLIAAGLYEDDGDRLSSANARVDSTARPMPICDDVFEDVEDMYYHRGDYIGGGGGMYEDGTDHRMLFDLANEALQSLVTESSRGGSWSVRRWVVDSTGVARGKKLVDDVWRQVQALRNDTQPQEMQTIEGMVSYEVRRSVWTEVLCEDVYVVGRKIERAIFDELIEDFFASDALEVFIR